VKGLDVSEGGSIEVFASDDDAESGPLSSSRSGQCGVGPFAEYDYRRGGRVLLRVAGNHAEAGEGAREARALRSSARRGLGPEGPARRPATPR
jgi:hypothetical protein